MKKIIQLCIGSLILMNIQTKDNSLNNHEFLNEYSALYKQILALSDTKNEYQKLLHNTYSRLRQEFLEELLHTQGALLQEIKTAAAHNKINKHLADRLTEHLFNVLANFSQECPPHITNGK